MCHDHQLIPPSNFDTIRFSQNRINKAHLTSSDAVYPRGVRFGYSIRSDLKFPTGENAIRKNRIFEISDQINIRKLKIYILQRKSLKNKFRIGLSDISNVWSQKNIVFDISDQISEKTPMHLIFFEIR